MSVLHRYFASEIYRAVLFVLSAFLSLFAFFDLMGELGSIGRGPYQVEHAMLYVLLGLPAYAYELMPIVALIGTIYVMAQFAARSEFTVMRASSLSMSRALWILLHRPRTRHHYLRARRIHRTQERRLPRKLEASHSGIDLIGRVQVRTMGQRSGA